MKIGGLWIRAALLLSAVCSVAFAQEDTLRMRVSPGTGNDWDEGRVMAADPAPRRGTRQGLSAFCTGDSERVLLGVRTLNPDGSSRTDTIAILPAESGWSQPVVAVSSEGYPQLAWCDNGRVYYTSTLQPGSSGDGFAVRSSLWLPLQLISSSLCEPASECDIRTDGERTFITWHASGAGVGFWRRSGLLRPGAYPSWAPCPVYVSPGKTPASVVIPGALSYQALTMKCLAAIPHGRSAGTILSGDSDHDSLGELIFHDGLANRWDDLECSPRNCYETALVDTGPPFPFPPGPQSGSLGPWDIGDIDGDSLTDLLGYVYDGSFGPWHWDLITEESSTYHSYPDTVSWYDSLCPGQCGDFPPCYLAGDLNNDGRQRALLWNAWDGFVDIYKNEGNNDNRLVARMPGVPGLFFTFGDFDSDGIREFATTGLNTSSQTYVYKKAGNDTYALVWTDTVNIPNGADVFSGDVDGDGVPEFFARFAWFPSSVADLYLFMYKAVGVNQYQRTLVAHLTRLVGNDLQALSKCGDVDGDGVDEVVWCIGSDVYVYKYVGNNQFEQVWTWHNPGGDDLSDAYVNVHDVNGDGYNEIIVSGDLAGTPGYPGFATFVYELEAVRVLSPNGGQALRAGDTCVIRWQTFTPPRCDSVSLFFTTDNGRNYRPIAHGLTPASDTFVWVIPDVHGDSCKVKAIAFGPGRQYDESDSCFSIWSAAVNEGHPHPVSETRLLGATPNPMGQETEIRYELRQRNEVLIRIRNTSGRTVAALPDEVQEAGLHSFRWDAGHIPEGVYFLSLNAGDYHGIMKLLKVK